MSKSKHILTVLIAGWGGMAEKHIQALRALRVPCRFVSLKDISWKEVDSLKPDFALITSPTAVHIEHALQLARRNIPFMMEKPVSSHTKGLSPLLNLVKKKKLLTYVCCQLRFDPSIIRIKKMLCHHEEAKGRRGDLPKSSTIGRWPRPLGPRHDIPHRIRVFCHSYLPHWRPGRDFRKTYSAQKNLGGGVAYDLIHEFDYLYWWLGKPKKIFGFRGKLSHLPIHSDDTCSAVLAYPKTLVEVSLGYADKHQERGFELYYEKRIIKGSVKGSPDLLKKQMAHFINCLHKKEKSLNPLSEGAEVLQLVQQLEDL
ncbi:MAG: Gfo/Idh/MocA family oxidoreductase [Deltaproteobacteria bacterium]|nr:MAG: Gfo/Idh/MocA family oxidoreductase [Deltaproteobacteria bacterium]